MAVEMAVTVGALRRYLEASEAAEKDQALKQAEGSLATVVEPSREVPVAEAAVVEPAVPEVADAIVDVADIALAEPAVGEAAVSIDELLYSKEDAIARARSLWTEAGDLLETSQPDLGHAQNLLSEALDLIGHALDRAGAEA